MSNPGPSGISQNGITNSQTNNVGSNGSTGPSQTNLNQIVSEYMLKKGFHKSEAMFRQESSNVDKDGRPIVKRAEDTGSKKYAQAFSLIHDWIDAGLDIYKHELARILWPLFVYSYLELVETSDVKESKEYLAQFRSHFTNVHGDELRTLETITLPQHILDNTMTKLYRENKYRLPMASAPYFTMINFLETRDKNGGTVVLEILQAHCIVTETQRGPLDQYSFDAIIRRARNAEGGNVAELEEGIPGAFTGVNNTDVTNGIPVKLGVRQMEDQLVTDLRARLEDMDQKDPVVGDLECSLVELLDRRIKREGSPDAISKNDIPYPAPKTRDVIIEAQRLHEYRSRFRTDTRTGGVGPAVSVCMWTFHNSLNAITCIEFSDDSSLVAVGTEESYIRIWSLTNKILESINPSYAGSAKPSSSRRLVGHSGPVYCVQFGPSSAPTTESGKGEPPKLLLSCGADGTIRLWSLEFWQCVIVYKGHAGPVWNVRWNPFGHYFVSGGHDKTVRVWTQSEITPVRLLVGHDASVTQVAYHPNGAYVFSASDTIDKTVRMWSVVKGECVRVFTGHTAFISAVECSPNGKVLASADGAGTIFLWDIRKGTLIKRMKGHGKGGIWSLSFSVESAVLTSGCCDGTVRVWDVRPIDGLKTTDGEVIGTGGQADAGRINGSAPATGTVAAGGSKKKLKEVVVTPDQISAFPTKQTPVLKVKFTGMNLVIAGGVFQPPGV